MKESAEGVDALGETQAVLEKVEEEEEESRRRKTYYVGGDNDVDVAGSDLKKRKKKRSNRTISIHTALLAKGQ